MRYQIKWAEVSTTSTGKTKATLTLTDEKGIEVDKVTAWADFTNFSELQPGKTVSGEVVVKQNGQFTNKTLYPERTNTLGDTKAPAWSTSGPTVAGKGGGIAKAQERKAEGIAKTMDRKEDGIKVSATFRDATLLTTMYFHGRLDNSVAPMEMVQTKWLEFRKWLWDHWDYLTPPNLPF